MEETKQITKLIVEDIVKYATNTHNGMGSEIERKVRFEVDYILNSKLAKFERLTGYIRDHDLEYALHNIATELFLDGISWGRISTFLAFLAVLSRQHRIRCMSIPKIASEALTKNTGVWITQQGGWKSFKKPNLPKLEMVLITVTVLLMFKMLF